MMQQNNNACASTLTTSSRATTGRVVASESRVQVVVRTSSNYLRTGWLVASS